jgi:ferredoxin--NADP+ reductase
MIGLDVGGKPLTRAYSIASANYEDTSSSSASRCQDGPLTSRLQHLRPATRCCQRKPTGTCWSCATSTRASTSTCSATGTGLAPFLS